MPELQAQLPVGGIQEEMMNVSHMSVSLSLSIPLCLKSTKTYLKQNYKKIATSNYSIIHPQIPVMHLIIYLWHLLM